MKNRLLISAALSSLVFSVSAEAQGLGEPVSPIVVPTTIVVANPNGELDVYTRERKSPLPVTIDFRPAVFGSTMVLKVSTTIKQDLPVLLTVSSPQLGTKNSYRFNLSWRSVNEIGHLQKVKMYSGDRIELSNLKYQEVAATVP